MNGEDSRVTVELTLPAAVANGPYKARAICQARLTPTQIVVESGEVVEQRGSTRATLGGLPYRFNRETKRRIPYVRGSWSLTQVFTDENRQRRA